MKKETKTTDEIIFVKRANPSNLRTFKNSVIKLEIKNSRFIISQRLAEILKVDNNRGVMFGFNQAASTGYIVKDDEPDAFILKRKDAHTLRFMSKDLMGYFDKTFNLLEKGDLCFIFTVESKPNKKGLHEIKLNSYQHL